MGQEYPTTTVHYQITSNNHHIISNNIIEQQSFVEMKHTHIVSHFLPKVIFILIGAVAWQDLHLEMVTF